MIEKTPIFNVTKETFDLLLDNELKSLFNKINTEYLYWDKVKYLAPKGVRPEDLWAAVKIIRNSNMKRVQLKDLTFSFMITEEMQKTLHEFDRYGRERGFTLSCDFKKCISKPNSSIFEKELRYVGQEEFQGY